MVTKQDVTRRYERALANPNTDECEFERSSGGVWVQTKDCANPSGKPCPKVPNSVSASGVPIPMPATYPAGPEAEDNFKASFPAASGVAFAAGDVMIIDCSTASSVQIVYLFNGGGQEIFDVDFRSTGPEVTGRVA